MAGVHLFFFPFIYVLTLVPLLLYQLSLERRTIQSEDVTRDSPKHLLFFSPDIHIGTTNDLAMALHSYGHSLYLFNKRCTLPRYSTVYNAIISPETYLSSRHHYGEIIIPNTTICNQAECKWFSMIYVNRIWSLFVNDPIFREADAIICMFYPSHCQNYLVFNKTTIFIPAHRFSLKRCPEADIRNLYKWMFEKPEAPVIVMAAGLYDAEYINYYSGRRVPYIIASSVLGYEPPDRYDPEFSQFIFAPFKFLKRGPEFRSNITSACQSQGFNCSVVRINEVLRRPFELSDINRFKAAILFPYAMLSYYIADLVTTAIPLFVPSPRMMARENIGFDARNNDIQYCWTRANELPRHPNTTHPFSPEDRSLKAVEYWTQFASFYTPCSIQFNDYNHLARLMRITNYSHVYECNLRYRETIKQHNDRVWKQLFPKIQRNRRFPNSISESLEWFNETTFFFWFVCLKSGWL